MVEKAVEDYVIVWFSHQLNLEYGTGLNRTQNGGHRMTLPRASHFSHPRYVCHWIRMGLDWSRSPLFWHEKFSSFTWTNAVIFWSVNKLAVLVFVNFPVMAFRYVQVTQGMDSQRVHLQKCYEGKEGGGKAVMAGVSTFHSSLSAISKTCCLIKRLEQNSLSPSTRNFPHPDLLGNNNTICLEGNSLFIGITCPSLQ